MTVLRREDVQSRVASWDGSPYRIASSPILAIVPLIIRRLRGPSPNRVIAPSPIRLVAACRYVRRYRRRLERRPQEARQLARDRDGDLRRRLVFAPPIVGSADTAAAAPCPQSQSRAPVVPCAAA